MFDDPLTLVQLKHKISLVDFGLLLQLHLLVLYPVLVTVVHLVGSVKSIVRFLFLSYKNTF